MTLSIGQGFLDVKKLSLVTEWNQGEAVKEEEFRAFELPEGRKSLYPAVSAGLYYLNAIDPSFQIDRKSINFLNLQCEVATYLKENRDERELQPYLRKSILEQERPRDLGPDWIPLSADIDKFLKNVGQNLASGSPYAELYALSCKYSYIALRVIFGREDKENPIDYNINGTRKLTFKYEMANKSFDLIVPEPTITESRELLFLRNQKELFNDELMSLQRPLQRISNNNSNNARAF